MLLVLEACIQAHPANKGIALSNDTMVPGVAATRKAVGFWIEKNGI